MYKRLLIAKQRRAPLRAASAIIAVVVISGCLRSQSPAKAECTGDAQCGNGLACVGGKCVVRTCSKDPDCPDGLACTDGFCAPIRRNCFTNGDCAAPMVCADIRCIELAPTDCELVQTSVDFGTIAAGVASTPMTLEIRNHTELPYYVSIGDVGAGDESAFSFSSDFTSGDHLVPAMAPDTTPGSLTVPLVFNPVALGEYTDTLPILRPCTGAVTLHGVAVEHTLVCSPGCPSSEPTTATCRSDFTYVHPGAKLVQNVIFTNLGTRAIHLTLGAITQPPGAGEPFAIEESNRTFSIPPGQGTISLALSFAPTQLGLQTATLAYSSDDPSRPSGAIELYGIGGGPSIEVQPAALDFDQVAVGTHQLRRVTVANGGEDVGGTDDDNLLFAAPDNCIWANKPAEIVGLNASDFSVEWPPQGYSTVGLAESQSADLRINFAPQTSGEKQAVLRIFSNDPTTPTIEVPLSGIGADLPPCDYDVQPAALDFGIVESNRDLTLSFSIVNRATSPGDACLLSMLDLDSITRGGAFTLVQGPQGSDSAVVIPGGGKLDVPVRFAPVQDGQYAGELGFFLSNPTRPEVTVSLSGIATPSSCLFISPREFDIGTIGVNCNSHQRLFTIYNTCGSNVIVTGIVMQPGPSAEYTITNRPALPVTIPGSGSAEFGVTYHPVDIGEDAAAVVVTLQGSPSPRYIVPLTGRGANDPVQTDMFGATDNKVDVLLIIDDTYTMLAKQTVLATNFNNFISAANLNQVDYHIAVTTVSWETPAYACGRFVPLTGSSPTRVITATTPNKEQVFSQNVQVGAASWSTEALIYPAYAALRNPLIGTHNSGFYRDEARLAIVVLSDAADQDPMSEPVSFYENFFISLKGTTRRNDFSFSGFIPLQATQPSNCNYDDPLSGTDPRARQLIQSTGGVSEEICSPDLSAAVGRIGDRVFGRQTTYFLSSAPDLTVAPDPILITINGAPYPQFNASGQQQWTYDSAANAIQFDHQANPSASSHITVSYHVACL